MTLEQFNSKYRYKLDSMQYGVVDLWEVMEPSSDGLYHGDCESYCLTLIDKVEGFEDLQLWYVENEGFGQRFGHCLGELNGMFIDCNSLSFRSKEDMLDNWKVRRKIGKFELYSNMLKAKIFKMLPRKIAISLYNFLK